MDWKQIEDRWEQLKSQAKSKWTKLTDEDVELIGGKRILLINLIQERYEITWDDAERQVSEWKPPVDAQPKQHRTARRAG